MYDLKHDLRHVLSHTQGMWEELKGANLFVTGGSGFVGTWLLHTFVAANCEFALNARAFVLTRDPEAFLQNRPGLAANRAIEILRGDIKTFSFRSARFPFLIHAAAEYADVAADLAGTRRILELASDRLLYLSSGAVYGMQSAELEQVSEDSQSPSDLATPYAQAKRASERLCLEAAASGLRVVIARLFAFSGPFLPLDKGFAIGNFVRDASAGNPICIDGDGTPIRSYLYAADLAIWLWTLLIKGTAGRAYNVGSDQAISILELAEAVRRVSGSRQDIRLLNNPRMNTKAQRYVPSIQRARSELGLKPLIPLDEGIRRMCEWSRFHEVIAKHMADD
jgi:nucleoside-diphosphate-sugar epimerase